MDIVDMAIWKFCIFRQNFGFRNPRSFSPSKVHIWTVKGIFSVEKSTYGPYESHISGSVGRSFVLRRLELDFGPKIWKYYEKILWKYCENIMKILWNNSEHIWECLDLYFGYLDLYFWYLDLYFGCLDLYFWYLDLYFGSLPSGNMTPAGDSKQGFEYDVCPML